MSNDGNQYRIKIIKNGPYLVSGGVPLLEKIIAPKGNEYEFIGGIPIESSDGHIYEVRNRLVLCRCGESRNKPFCDATHISVGFSDSGQK